MKKQNETDTLIGRVWLSGIEIDQLQKAARNAGELSPEQYELLNLASSIRWKLVNEVTTSPETLDSKALAAVLEATDMVVNKIQAAAYRETLRDGRGDHRAIDADMPWDFLSTRREGTNGSARGLASPAN
jgi:hypothetical protein